MITHRICRGLLLVLLAMLALPWTAWSQDTNPDRPALPSIAPREVEILGTLEVSLPSLQRQPLIGFNPPPEVPLLPAGRRPFTEAYKQASNELPESPLQRPQPPSAISATAPPAEGQVESLVGRYFSRIAKARLQAPLSDQASFVLRADYRGSDGHEPFEAAPDVNAPFDTFEGLVGLQTSRQQWAAGFTLSGFYESYTLFGLQPIPLPSDLSLLPAFDREGSGGTGAVHLQTLADAPLDLRLDLRYGASRYKTSRVAAGMPPTELSEQRFPTELSEQRFEADVAVSVPVTIGDAWVEGTASTASLGDNLGTYTALEAGGGVLFEVDPALSLRLGARFLSALSDTDQPRRGSGDTRIGYLSPDVRLEFLPMPGARLYAHNRPGVDANAVADVFRVNPYLIPRPELRPTIRSVDAEVGGSVFTGPVQWAAQVGFQKMPQALYFEADPDAGSRGRTLLQYGEAEVFRVGGSVSVVLPGGLHAMVGAAYRDGRLLDDDVAIPYFAPVVGEATLSYAFARNRGLFQLTGHYQSSRYVARAPSPKVGSYIDLDLEASYKITTLLGVVFRIENISGSDNARWDNYPESPAMIGAGLRVSW